jgi:ubiquinone/menaquinone biosynthesis C-methylase UbiE
MMDHFDLLARCYDRLVGSSEPARLRDMLKLPTDGCMLDAGGGTGRASSQLSHLVGSLVISDLSRPMLRQAKAKGERFAVQAHTELLPFSDGMFDRILVVDALHHFCDQRVALMDLLRVLKPGGRLLIEEPDINRFGVKLAALAEKLALMRSHFLAPSEIRDIIAAQGLSAAIENDGRFAAWVVVDK